MTCRCDLVCSIAWAFCATCCAQAAGGEHWDLPTACLMASGVADQAELSRARQRLDAACQPIAAALQAELPHEVRAGILLAQMHARVLTGQYDKSATDWRTALDRGNYNCLSALAIYHELCRRADVPLTLWAEPGHVHCRLGELRIEPTSRQWPAPADSGSAAARQITPEQLVGRFHYNRGIELLANRDFAGGVAALHSACRLDPLDTDARANLLAGLNNWALALSADEQHAAARSLIFRGLAIDPDYAPLVANEHYLRSLVGQ